MSYLSTAGGDDRVSLARALRLGLAEDGGLFFPRRIEPLPSHFFEQLPGMSLAEVSRHLATHLLGDDIDSAVLASLTAEALNFPIPLVSLNERQFVLELFHGPTLAFKDVGARTLARLLAATEPRDGASSGEQDATVLVATSGDTGGAVAQAFYGVAGTRVAILYPDGKVSPVQERQFTTLGGNIRAFAVDGTFDDCQRLVKQCFADRDLHRRLSLTSANSINIGRLLPQIFYYFYAAAQLPGEGEILFSTPSGNFGNLTAGLMARALGLEARFIAATNVNDVVPEYLTTGRFTPRASRRTLSNAMDVGNPSNFDRILHLYGGNHRQLCRHVSGASYSDEETTEAIRRVDRQFGYVMDPHTAVAYLAMQERITEEAESVRGIILATAHPAKFSEVVEPAIGRSLPLPEALAAHLDRQVVSEQLPADESELRRRLLAW